MRLKDADKILEAIANSGMIWETNECLDVIEVLAVKKIIDDAPTIDSLDLDVHIGGRCCGKRQRLLDELRPKGKWIEDKNAEYGWKCSECGDNRHRASSFCPNCGADMRGENV